ncbi:TPA: LOW QUALITY PROTEIN: hypothetical protein N0F65_003080 [Lagenidium giganteum]|uniref:Apple domain-containing protein n=1 Tax=Lagenidium giganteum TaxID=4803 RepID=A0AAV2YIS1_9STRA|nr:TPA: LOW QUALITY PROTEIN: hypothetical protein N0F65_003080 [Lagenidium giganteum]
MGIPQITMSTQTEMDVSGEEEVCSSLTGPFCKLADPTVSVASYISPITLSDLAIKKEATATSGASSIEEAAATPKCAFQHFPGSWMDNGGDENDLMSQAVTTHQECEMLCCRHPRCQSYTFWMEQMCFLRSIKTFPRADGHSFSAFKLRHSREVILSVMEKIELLVEHFLRLLAVSYVGRSVVNMALTYRRSKDGRLMNMEALKREMSAMSFNALEHRLEHRGSTRLIRLNRHGARKYTAVWLVLQTAYELLRDQRTATQREVYYLHTFFKSQSEADSAILDAGSILGVPRESLNIVGATKGSFCGPLSVKRNDHWVEYVSEEANAITPSLLLLQPHEIASPATCILVVEKDGQWVLGHSHEIINSHSHEGIFNRLRHEHTVRAATNVKRIKTTTHRLRQAVSEATGNIAANPSVWTLRLQPFRAFHNGKTRTGRTETILSSSFVDLAEVPTRICKDADGIRPRRYGLCPGYQMVIDGGVVPVVDVKWIGLRPSQIASIDLPDVALKALTPRDMSTAASIAMSPFVQARLSPNLSGSQAHSDFSDEVQRWVLGDIPFKIELEALHLLGFDYLNEFVQFCIQNKVYI